MLALIVGTILAVGALAYVLFPLLAGAMPVPRRFALPAGATDGAPEQEAVVALREIEFDRATGKLSDADYEELKARYTERALHALRATGAATPDELAEAAVVAFRARLKSCARCGPRPEPDATYCSGCGSYLPGACGSCGATVTESGAAFCASCGRQLAA
ncbi:MAG TPA: zinc ribbon domain-containing protein [Gemmatimonadaceae bacterium]|nr:zinc ribbon domain-containing protein [Gemmatimonadaceae bacterium]